jgi:hypothetical protein
MRQGNGNDVLGVNDPRSADVGIVYVSPNDDRKTVLAGILTQEKLGRKYIALVLPNQNKAFQRPVDFDDLKGLRRKLQAQLVLIAPVNSTPAELARQRRFTVYSSLENFASAVRSAPPQAEPKRSNGVRGLFGSARYKAIVGQHDEASERAANGPSVPPGRRTSQALAPRGEEHHEEDHSISDALAGAAILGAVEEARRRQPVDPDHNTNTGAGGLMPDVDSGENVDGVDAMSFPGVQETPRDDEDESLPPPAPVPSPSEKASRTGSKPSRAGSTDPARTDPAPIDLQPPPRARGRDTAKLAQENAPASRSRGALGRRRDNDKAAVVAGAGAALGAAALVQKTSGGSATAAKSGGATKARGAGGGGGSRGSFAGGQPPSGRRRLLLGIALIAAVLLIVLGTIVGMAYANPGFGGPLQSILPRGLPPATIIITPDSKTVANTYVILAVPNGQTNINQRQVAARPLTSQQSTSKQINATGHTQIPAAAAHGTLTFENGSFTTPFTVGAGQTFTAGNGTVVATDAAVTISAGNGVTYGVASVAAHAVNPGAAGNIGARAIDGACCTSSGNIFVFNSTAFTGGQDAKNYSFVQQSDVDAFVNGAVPQLTNQANNALRGQLKSGEQLAQATNCPSTMTHNNPIGDQGVNVTSTNVTVSVTCSAVAYDANAMQNLVSQLLQRQAASSAGPGYALNGNVVVQSQVQQVNDDRTVSLLVTAKGLWVYQFSNQQKQQLAKLVAGKSINSAKAILQAQPGVHSVTISSNNATLPTDPSQIAISIQTLSGLQSAGTPTPFPAPPASTPKTPQPGRGDIVGGNIG